MTKNSARFQRVFLSHPWGPSCPPYAGGEGVSIKPTRSLAAGDSCNAVEFKAPNHIGTHFDFPSHFHPSGKHALNYSPDFFVHDKTLVFWFETPYGHLIEVGDLEHALRNYDGDGKETLILVRSGASLYRHTAQFWQAGPGIAPGVANFLRKTFSQLTSVGLDSISISSLLHREIGRSVHHEFLCHERPLLIIEDMDLEPLAARVPHKVIALPLRLEEGDGAPCTVIAEL